ncbi:MAG: XRE family transcriptional regulator [Alphaproteobacteria bacterium]|nr:MAG: XRE family transcriptional regulator [Alphaproteobacteria bacterium]
MVTIADRIKRTRTNKGLTQAALANALDINQSTVAYWENNRSEPDARTVETLGRILGVTPEWIMFGGTSAKSIGPSFAPPPTAKAHKDLPVLGMAQAGKHSTLVITETPVSFIDRPPNLAGNNSAFAVWVAGKSMEPRFRLGEIIYINPAKPVDAGCFVLIELLDGSAFVKELIKQTQSKVILRQYNPAKDLEIALTEVKNIYRVVGCSEG